MTTHLPFSYNLEQQWYELKYVNNFMENDFHYDLPSDHFNCLTISKTMRFTVKP